MRRRLGPGLALALVLAATGGCGGQESGTRADRLRAGGNAAGATTTVPGSAATAAPAPESVDESIVAHAIVPSVGIYDSPVRPEPSRRLANPMSTGSQLVFLVRERHAEWLNVLLPVRPNGSTGWIRQADVDLTSHDFRIIVELDAHQITVMKGAEVFMKEPVGIGRSETPTPGGLYYTKELLQPSDSNGQPIVNGPYGPYAYALSGFSEVLYNFAGGDGVIGIHGTNDPAGIGKDVSHGCIRMRNEAITKLAHTLPVGVPVEIRA